MPDLPRALDGFRRHYQQRLKEVSLSTPQREGIAYYYYLDSPLLKPGNGPRILYHGEATRHAIVLTHGLSDSPYYMEAIARRFYQEGCNVVLPLLPAHGLRQPDKAMKDKELDSKWKTTVDNGIATAKQLGQRVSLGGFSTGGAVSLNRILNEGRAIEGGLFLFSAALSIGDMVESAGRLSFLQSIARISDGEVVGIGQNPYTYPQLPSFAGIELVQIINENNRLRANGKVSHPVFAIHSAHDTTVTIDGLLEFIEQNVENGALLLLSRDIPHASLPLDTDIPLDLEQELPPEHPPRANPLFGWMMDSAIQFFHQEVAGG